MHAIHVAKDIFRRDPLGVFRLVFGLHGLFFWMRIFGGYDSLFGASSIPKEIAVLRYQDPLLKWIFNLADHTFIGAGVLGASSSLCILLWSYSRLMGKNCRLRLVRPMFFIFWLCLALFFVRFPSVRSVHIDYMGWLSLLNVLISEEDKWVRSDISWGAWIFFSVGYLYSGIRKAELDPWLGGYAVQHILRGPIGRFEFDRQPLEILTFLSPILSWSVVMLELVAPLMIWRRLSRVLLLTASATFHLGVLAFLRIPDLTVSILLFHLFLGVTLIRPRG